jgi:alcohol dehydrogenase (NADP+)
VSSHLARYHTVFSFLDSRSNHVFLIYTLTTFRFDKEHQVYHEQSVQRELGLHEVLIKTTHASLCFTDVHANFRGIPLGHEGVGIIEQVGAAVTTLKVGQRAGWGWLHSSCSHCSSCVDGYRQYCSEASGFGYSQLDQGAFGDYRMIDADFAYAIPDSITSDCAAPFMCAGASTYEALDAADVKSSDRVGIVGIGGLGTMAIQFARAMGCAVTAISASSRTDSDKTTQILRLGADEFRCTQDLESCSRLSASGEICKERKKNTYGIDVLIICSNEVPDFSLLLPLLARRARIVLMSIQQQPLILPYMPFILPGHKIIASTEASRRNHLDMLEFAARNNIVPLTEKFPMTAAGLKDAFERLESGKMRYRGVFVR